MNAARTVLAPARFAVLVNGAIRGGTSYPEYMDAIRVLLGLRKGERTVVGLDEAGQAYELDESEGVRCGTRMLAPIAGITLAPAARPALRIVK